MGEARIGPAERMLKKLGGNLHVVRFITVLPGFKQVNTRTLLFSVLAAGIFAAGAVPAAWGSAQLNAFIIPGNSESNFDVTYQRTVILEYDEGGQIADLLRGASDSIDISVESGDPGTENLKALLNSNLLSSDSSTSIRDLDVIYRAVLRGNPLGATLSYEVQLTGTLQGYTIIAGSEGQQTVVDMAWRDITVRDPVVLQGAEINLPISAMETMAPEVVSLLPDDALELLRSPLIVATSLHEAPLGQWHFLFDPTGINADASQFGLSEEIAGIVESKFTLGESSIREGIKTEVEEEVEFALDRTYVIKTLESSDIANVHIVGFAVFGDLDGAEIVGVTPTAPEGGTSTGDFPVLIIYGMAGLAAVGGVAFFVFSNRALKKEEGMGQQGIDPSQLTAYQTSSSSGGYQTNRAEAQLRDSGEYQKHRSVYDEQQSQPPPKDDEPSTRRTMPKGWKQD